MRHTTTSVLTILVLALSLSACASNKRRARPELPPERKNALYERVVGKWDYNRDGVVTCADVSAVREGLFNNLDTDRSGSLSRQEFRFAQFEDKSFLFYPFDQVDLDLEPGISLVEFSQVQHSEFAGYDRDKDCTVTVDEAAEALRDEFQRRPDRPGKQRKPLPPPE